MQNNEIKPLGKKQSISNDAWLETVKNIEKIISKTEINKLEKDTIEEIKKTVGDKTAAYAWSGGKDSIVLGHICEKAGIHDCMIGVCDLEYPEFMKWIEENKPKKCEIINTKQGIDWLMEHQKMLFPQNSPEAAAWFHIVQHRAQRIYFRAHKLDVLCLGRRRADGNYVGKGSNIYTTKSEGVTRYSPLADWTHEQILGYIHYNKLALPPIYDWKNGYLCGTHPWPARQWTESVENGWREVYEIDHSIVENAAEHIQSAKKFLEETK